MTKKGISVLISIALLFCLAAGCGNDSEPTTIEAGFGYKDDFGDFLYGAKSNKVIFDVDDVTIDFYFGYSNRKSSWFVSEGYERVCIAAYFYGYESYEKNFRYKPYEDYRNVSGCYLIKEFSVGEFFTEQYAATYTSGSLFTGTTNFNYYETFTIPKEIFGKEAYHFFFGIADVWLSLENGEYIFGNTRGMYGGTEDLRIRYEYTNDHQVKISVR